MIPYVGSLQPELAVGQPSGGDKSMTMVEADARFLKRILMALVAATLVTGLMAGLATVKAERAMIASEISE
jgi:hypothetical protein